VQSRTAEDRSASLALVFGDEATFRTWYEAHAPRVLGYLRARCGGDAVLAEELTQQTFLHAIRGRRAYDGRADHATWLIAIARNRLVDHLRGLEREERRHRRLVVREIILDRDVRAWDDHALRDLVIASLQRLPAAQRAALVLHHADGLSIAEVARLMGRSASAVESLLARGRASFRRAFGESTYG
jgi:RNA polymerase sigma-70 factor (ECF subfamily)